MFSKLIFLILKWLRKQLKNNSYFADFTEKDCSADDSII